MNRTFQYGGILLAIFSAGGSQAAFPQGNPGNLQANYLQASDQGLQTTDRRHPVAIIVTERQSGQTIALKTKQILEVRLPSNPSTGYSWELTERSELLQQVGKQSFAQEPQKRNMPGAGGTEMWRFKAEKQGRVKLSFAYRRPWEKGIPAKQTIDYTAVIK
jgi:inhibitor of cysteine peptidase